MKELKDYLKSLTIKLKVDFDNSLKPLYCICEEKILFRLDIKDNAIHLSQKLILDRFSKPAPARPVMQDIQSFINTLSGHTVAIFPYNDEDSYGDILHIKSDNNDSESELFKLLFQANRFVIGEENGTNIITFYDDRSYLFKYTFIHNRLRINKERITQSFIQKILSEYLGESLVVE